MPVIRPCPGPDLRPDPPHDAADCWALGVPVAFQNLIISIGGLGAAAGGQRFRLRLHGGHQRGHPALTGLIELAGNVAGHRRRHLLAGTEPGRTEGWIACELGLRRSAQIARGHGAGRSRSFWSSCSAAPLLSLFINDEPELVEQVLTYGCRYLNVMSAGLFMLYLLFVYRSTLQGLGDTVIPMISGFVELSHAHRLRYDSPHVSRRMGRVYR